VRASGAGRRRTSLVARKSEHVKKICHTAIFLLRRYLPYGNILLSAPQPMETEMPFFTADQHDAHYLEFCLVQIERALGIRQD
jgi:hypothetical protein